MLINPFQKQNSFSFGEQDFHSNLTHERKPNRGMLMNLSTLRKATVNYYPTHPKFDNDEFLPPK